MINKKIAVFFYDGKNISKRVGILKSFDNFFIYLKTEFSESEAINKKNIVRMVLLNGED